MSANFYQISIFHQMITLQNLKRPFRSRDIQIFIFSSSPIIFPASHCFRGWSKKNLKVYHIIKCLNKNLITHFVWYIEKDVRCDIETLSIDRVLNKEHFMETSCRKCARKAIPRPFLILLSNPEQLLIAKNSFKNQIFWKRIIKKP